MAYKQRDKKSNTHTHKATISERDTLKDSPGTVYEKRALDENVIRNPIVFTGRLYPRIHI